MVYWVSAKIQCPHRSSTPISGRATKIFLIPYRTLSVQVGGKVGGKNKALPDILSTFRCLLAQRGPMRKVCTKAVKSITEKLRPPPAKLSKIPAVSDKQGAEMAAKVEFLHIPGARGWEVHEIQALLGAWEELHVILRL